MRYLYKRLDNVCEHLHGYDKHAVHGLILKDGRTAAAVFVHRRNEGVKTLGNNTMAESGGGIRFCPVSGNDIDAYIDGLRLSRMMSQKSVALFGDSQLALGGAKTVVFTHNVPYVVGSDVARREFWRVLGEEVLMKIGTYLTAEDMGTTPEDLAYLAQYAPRGLVTGFSTQTNPSPITARGVVIGMEEAVRERGEVDIDPYALSFMIQGVGNVGSRVLDLLWKNGARNITISDTTPQAVEEARKGKRGLTVVSPDTSTRVEADIFMPCAAGSVLNESSIPNMYFSVIAGCANNQLATPEDGIRLHTSGIFYVPDYIINAGGLAKVISDAITGGNVDELLERIRSTLRHVFAESARLDKAPSAVADEMIAKHIAKLRPAA